MMKGGPRAALRCDGDPRSRYAARIASSLEAVNFVLIRAPWAQAPAVGAHKIDVITSELPVHGVLLTQEIG